MHACFHSDVMLKMLFTVLNKFVLLDHCGILSPETDSNWRKNTHSGHFASAAPRLTIELTDDCMDCAELVKNYHFKISFYHTHHDQQRELSSSFKKADEARRKRLFSFNLLQDTR
jgi:hypothetical protein